jgi:hypothetical protein
MATAELETQEETGWNAMSASEKAASVTEMPDVNLSVDGAGAPGVVKEAGAKSTQESPKPIETEQDETLSGGADDDSGAADADAQDEVVEGEEVVEDKSKRSETDWHDDADTYDFAKRMGISDEDYDEISSREELDRTLRVIDRKAYDAEKSRLAGGQLPVEQTTTQDAAQQQTQQDLFAAEKAELANMVDESSMPFVNKIFDGVSAKMQQVLSRFEQAEQQRAADALHGKIEASIDGLNNPERYGKPGEKLTRAQSANRAKFKQELLMRGSAHERAGRFLEPAQLAKYADAAAFVDDNRLTIQREYDERLRKESRRTSLNAGGSRHGSRGSSKKSPSKEAIREEILADPEIEQAFAKLHGR